MDDQNNVTAEMSRTEALRQLAELELQLQKKDTYVAEMELQLECHCVCPCCRQGCTDPNCCTAAETNGAAIMNRLHAAEARVKVLEREKKSSPCETCTTECPTAGCVGGWGCTHHSV